jgi:hypothetical protein
VIELINTSALTTHINEFGAGSVIATAKQIEMGNGYLLHIEIDNKTLVLSTWRSTTPRLFKRADALLTEAKNIGLSSVKFPL